MTDPHNNLLAHDLQAWGRFRSYAMEQDCFPGKLSCVWTTNRENLYLPNPGFRGRSWLDQTNREASAQGAELGLHKGVWYFIWPKPMGGA